MVVNNLKSQPDYASSNKLGPLLDLISLLRPKAALFGAGLDAFGEWAMSFRRREDLLFCSVEQGECMLLRPNLPPITLHEGDFVLIFTSTPFTIASKASAKPPVDSEEAVAAAGQSRVVLGTGQHDRVTLNAGKFVFHDANREFLAEVMPSVVHIDSRHDSAPSIRALLALNEVENRAAGPASEFIIVRLVELVLAEALRAWGSCADDELGGAGLLVALSDGVCGKALIAMHRQVDRNWTVGELADHCGVSRSKFAARFRKIMGMAPVEYLFRLRMALAKDALARGDSSVGAIAFSIGFHSSSAFTTAFTRAVGCPPTEFARNVVKPT